MTNDWITTEQAAKLRGYHPYYLRELIRGRKIKAQKFGPIWQVDRSSLLAYIRAAEKSKDKRRGAKKSG